MSEAKSTIATGASRRSGVVRIRSRAGPVRFDDDRCRLDDRLGHLHRFRRHCAQHGIDGRLARGLDHHRLDDRCRGAFLRRTRGHDAEGRRAIRLPARSVLSALGIFVRLDAFPRHSDRNHRRRGRGFCAIPRRPVARHFSERVDRSADRALRQIRDQPFRAATRGAAADSVSDGAQHARLEAREVDPEYFHFGEDAGRLPR